MTIGVGGSTAETELAAMKSIEFTAFLQECGDDILVLLGQQAACGVG